MKVLSPQRGAPNTDGIDPVSSNHILFDHYFASTGDDDIAIKSGPIDSPGPDSPSTDITIVDCQFEAGHGLSLGSELAGGAQRIHAERVSFKGTDNGIRIKANRDRGNDVSDICFKDITMDGVKTSILISEFYPKEKTTGEIPAAPVGRLTPHFHDIVFENIKSVNGDVAGIIMGLPEAPLKNITMKNVSIEAKTGITFGYAEVQMIGSTVKVADGPPMTIAPTATVTIK
jgi:polygalacturonase